MSELSSREEEEDQGEEPGMSSFSVGWKLGWVVVAAGGVAARVTTAAVPLQAAIKQAAAVRSARKGVELQVTALALQSIVPGG